MARIEFGQDLIDVLEKKYHMKKVGEVPTKYRNGVTTIYYMYSFVDDIDDMDYDTPYIEFTVDSETDGFIGGEMFPEGGTGLGTQFDFFEDLKYFIKRANLPESRAFRKSTRKARKSFREARLDTEKVWETLIKGEDYPYVDGTLSLADFEQSDYFFIPTSSFDKFPKKRPSSGVWGCKAKFINERGSWEDCIIHCILPWKENLDAMGKKWNEITSYMLLVQGVYVNYIK